jgi:pyruvate kinase
LSFVQQPEDVVEARDLIAGRAAIMVKVEKPSAVDRFDEIVDAFDGIMVARGDLGVELPPERVPIAQKNIIQACRQRGKPVIVATQMLDSMVHSPIPTRAEASDVATAVYEGADAVMLSAESAAGDYPVEAVVMMARIIDSVEDDPRYRSLLDTGHPEPESIGSDAITSAACRVARSVGASTIVTYTTSGSTALRAARERPDVPIMGLTPKRKTARRLALSWGVVPIHTEDVSSVDEMVDKACAITSGRKLAKAAEQIVITAGMPFGTPGTTNLLRLARISEACSP